MAETWYRVQGYLNRIKPVPVEKVTEAFVVIDGRRNARAGNSEFYEPTYAEARKRLIEYHEDLVARATSMLAVRQKDLELAQQLPTEPA